jgi:hypothetical protein
VDAVGPTHALRGGACSLPKDRRRAVAGCPEGKRDKWRVRWFPIKEALGSRYPLVVQDVGPPLHPLTPREQRVAESFRRAPVADTCTVVVAALLGLLARALVHAYCDSAPQGPAEGSPAWNFCVKVGHGYSWPAYPAAAVALAGAVLVVWRRRKCTRRIALLV